jgi:gliding motility-associated-like protein
VNQTLEVSANSGPTDCGLTTGFVTFPVTGQTGTVNYEMTGNGIIGTINQGLQNNLSSGWYYITVNDAVCSAQDSVFVGLNDGPIAEIGTSSLVNFSPFTTTFFNGSSNADSYFWDFGNGETLSTTTLESQTITYVGEGPLDITVCVVAIQPGCTDTACVVVTILEFIPPPVFDIPNVFSPNGDGNNDFWNFIDLEFVDFIELTVLNRWGNVVFEQMDGIPVWDGKLPNGGDATEGVYFYKYMLQGKDGSQHEGHGYMQLIRQ